MWVAVPKRLMSLVPVLMSITPSTGSSSEPSGPPKELFLICTVSGSTGATAGFGGAVCSDADNFLTERGRLSTKRVSPEEWTRTVPSADGPTAWLKLDVEIFSPVLAQGQASWGRNTAGGWVETGRTPRVEAGVVDAVLDESVARILVGDLLRMTPLLGP